MIHRALPFTVVVLLAACTGPSGSTGAAPARAGGTCAVDRDCGGGFFCDLRAGSPGQCRSNLCTSDAECTDGRVCIEDLQVCDIPICACSAGERCVNTTADGLPTSSCVQSDPRVAARCTLTPARVVLAPGGTHRVEPLAIAAGGVVLPYPAWQFSSEQAAIAQVDAQGTVSALGPGDATISAVSGDARCTVDIVVLNQRPADALRVFVVDPRNGHALPDTPVLLRRGNGTEELLMTDSSGGRVFTSAGDVTDVTAFGVEDGTAMFGRSWVTVMHPAPGDLVIELDALPPPDRVSGVTGTFELHPDLLPRGDVQGGIAAFSVEDVTDWNAGTHFGPTVHADINLASAGFVRENVPYPSGLFAAVNTNGIKTRVDVYQEHACSRREGFTWSLGGSVPLSSAVDVTDATTPDDPDLDAADSIHRMLRRMPGFRHGLQFVENLDCVDRPQGETPPAFSTETVHRPAYVLSQQANFAVTPPSLTDEPGHPVNSAVLVVTGARVPGHGIVPLGFQHAFSSVAAAEGKRDFEFPNTNCGAAPRLSATSECDDLADGTFRVRFAPPHDGLEGRDVVVTMTAGDVPGTRYSDELRSALHFTNPSTTETNTFAATWLRFTRAMHDPAARRFQAEAPDENADGFQVVFSSEGRTWRVFTSDAQDLAQLQLPSLPTGMGEDRVATAVLHAYRMAPGSPAFDTLLQPGGGGIHALSERVSASSRQECLRAPAVVACTADSDCSAAMTGFTSGSCASGVCVRPGIVDVTSGPCPSGYRAVDGPGGVSTCVRIPWCETL